MNSQPQHRTLRSWVLESLSEQILTGQLHPGQQLIEAQLATDMGISRSPIREALRQLEQSGLVVTLPNASTTVAPIHEADIDQVYELRELLETEIVRHASARRTDQEVLECRMLLEEMREIAKSADASRFAAADNAFHRSIWSMGKRPKMSEILGRLINETRRYVAIWPHRLVQATLIVVQEDHESILNAIAGSDKAAATQAMRHHLSTTRIRTLQNLAEYKEVNDTQRFTPGNTLTSR